MVQEEFEKIATDIRQRVIAVARGYRLDADSAEDVAQDTMLKLWTIREKTDGRKSATAMAVMIARHLSIDMLRKRRTVGLDAAMPMDSRFRQPDAMLESAENPPLPPSAVAGWLSCTGGLAWRHPWRYCWQQHIISPTAEMGRKVLLVWAQTQETP